MILGICDVAGKYYVPQIGSFIIYFLMVALMIAVPGRTVREARMNESTSRPSRQRPACAAVAIVPRLPTDRWRALELAFWLLPVAAFFLFPNHRVLGSQILITGLFAVTLDLILGYAGIVSLGHAAFFGMGAYAAGLLAVHGWGEPISAVSSLPARPARSSASRRASSSCADRISRG